MPSRPKRMLLTGPQHWTAGPVDDAVGFRLRWRGLRRSAGDHGMLLRTASVHGCGLQDPLWAVALSSRFDVRAVAVLGRGGLIVDPGATWFLELPGRWEPPRPGWRLRVERWPEP